MADEPKLPLYPVYLYEEGFEPPKTGRYYLIAKDGVYFHKETKVGSALIKVKGIPWLQDADTEIKLKLPKIPGRIIGQALTFFRKVFEKYQSESYLQLYYSPSLDQYRLWCPKQRVTRGSVNYDRSDQFSYEERDGMAFGKGAREQEVGETIWQMVGTIHSHCDFSAFHSGTDEFDESTFDGVHITIGHVNRQQFSLVSSVAFNNTREQMDPENCILGIIRQSNRQVTGNRYMTWGDSHFFELALSDEDAQGLVQDNEVIDQEWMPKVEHGWAGGSQQKSFQGGNVASGGDWWGQIYGGRDFID